MKARHPHLVEYQHHEHNLVQMPSKQKPAVGNILTSTVGNNHLSKHNI